VAANGSLPDLLQDSCRQDLSTKDHLPPSSSPREDAELLLLSLIHFCRTELLSEGWQEGDVSPSEL